MLYAPAMIAGSARTTIEHAQRLASHAGLGTVQTVTQLAGGGNNRAYRVLTDTGDALLKAYFQHPDDPRDRLGREYTFSRFAWDADIRCIPEPLARDDEHKLGLYRFIDGRMLDAHEVNATHVQQAIAFFKQLNAKHSLAEALPAGSEACFSSLEHVALVDQRIRKLDAIAEPDAGMFIENELKPAWHAIHMPIGKDAASRLAAPRCLSPSDFGFHNAMQPAVGPLVFHDFEYAGWDDPAKVVGDFFHQPRRPAPRDSLESFISAVCETLSLGDEERERIVMLLPVYRVKWACIILSPLLPAGAARRRFAGVAPSPASLVNQARAMLNQTTAGC